MPFNKKNGVVDKTEWTDNSQDLWVSASDYDLRCNVISVEVHAWERETSGTMLSFEEAAELRDFLTDALQRAGHE